jgi:hypothetical protein
MKKKGSLSLSDRPVRRVLEAASNGRFFYGFKFQISNLKLHANSI